MYILLTLGELSIPFSSEHIVHGGLWIPCQSFRVGYIQHKSADAEAAFKFCLWYTHLFSGEIWLNR